MRICIFCFRCIQLWWLKDLCMIVEQEVHQPENIDNDDMIASLENYLRHLIELDPDNFQAKLKLSRLLLNKGANQEAKSYIVEVEETEQLQDNALKLEMLGSLCMNTQMPKLSIKFLIEEKSQHFTDSYIGVAMSKFLGAVSKNSESDEAFWGLGKNLKTVTTDFFFKKRGFEKK